MKVFEEYSKYYDLLYRDKDYSGEAEFVERLIRTHHPAAQSILELGCGTGRHAELLARKGFRVHGIDCSEGMLNEARTRASFLPPDMTHLLKISSGDVRTACLGEQFDAVISLFHVMSYQTENHDLNAVFATARKHLTTDGIFIFDFWFGPAVLAEVPEVRVKRLSDADIDVIRIAEPELHPEQNSVTVNYEILLCRKAEGTFSRLTESHRMRYLFLPEICSLFERHGMQPVFTCEWMSGKTPGLDTWSVCVGGRVVS